MQQYKVLHFYPDSSGLEKGQIFDLGDTYCSIVVVRMNCGSFGVVMIAMKKRGKQKIRGY